MKMVSYAQNGEDVMLSRALRGVQHGFYIDVGAAGPTEHSVTRTFYERGWTGINVEPATHFFGALAAARPHDVNIQAVLAAAPGERAFFAFEGTGLSTLDPQVAEGHKPGGWPMTRTTVQARTLAGICAEWAPPVIHFLKIDVEGAEAEVLRGADFTRWRPWIVVVEATRPMSPEPDFAGWEPLLTGAGYEFAWFDGLNRFYLAAERADGLRGHFRVPINYFDDFDRYDPAVERLQAEMAQERTAAEAGRAESAAARLDAALARNAANTAETRAREANDEAAGLRGRVAALGNEAAELRQRLEDSQNRAHAAALAAEEQRATSERRLAEQHAHTHHRRLAQEAAETRILDLEARLRFLDRLAAPPAPEEGAGRPAGVLASLYWVTLRPLVRPGLWRARTFLLSGLRRDVLTQHEETRQAQVAAAARLVDVRNHLDAAVGTLHAALQRPVPAPAPETAHDAMAQAPSSRELTELAQAMEAALMTLAVTAAHASPAAEAG